MKRKEIGEQVRAPIVLTLPDDWKVEFLNTELDIFWFLTFPAFSTNEWLRLINSSQNFEGENI